MHPDQLNLLQTICERPADDHPRLVYADYIERDDPHLAEFIRCQIRTAERIGWYDISRRLPLLPTPKFWCDADGCIWPGSTPVAEQSWCAFHQNWNRELTLWDQHESTWRNELRGSINISDPQISSLESVQEARYRFHVAYVFHRGFPARIRTNWRTWVDLHETIYWNGDGWRRCPHCEGTGYERYADAAGDMDDRDCPCTRWIGEVGCPGRGYVPHQFGEEMLPLTSLQILEESVEYEYFDSDMQLVRFPEVPLHICDLDHFPVSAPPANIDLWLIASIWPKIPNIQIGTHAQRFLGPR